MSWHCSRALVEVCLAAKSLAGKQSARLRSTNTAAVSSSTGKTKGISIPSQSGMTSRPSTGNRGVDWWTLCLEASRARTSPLQAREKELKGRKAVYGRKCGVSFAKFDQHLSGWKIPRCLLAGDWARFSGTWPRWGMMQDGECFRLLIVVPRTKGRESGLWQTLVADDAVNRRLGKFNSRGEPKLSGQVKLWPTPRASENENRQTKSSPSQLMGKHGRSLAAEVGGSLNPMWVEWLMGWPIGWTDLHPLATDRFRQWLSEHGTRF